MTQDYPDAMVRVGAYDWPRPPTTSSLRLQFRQLRRKVGLSKPDPASKAPDKLEALPKTLLPDSIWDDLRARYHALLDDQFLPSPTASIVPTVPQAINALVTLPSLPDGFVEDWAAARDVSIPNRGATVAEAEGLTLIPLTPMAHRTLSAREATRRQFENLAGASLRQDGGAVVLFGSSWAWTYLAHSSSLRSVVEDAFCFPAYDGTALAKLIKTHIGALQLSSVETGKDILHCDRDGHPKDNYLAALAATSNGCPWAALHLLEEAATRQKDPDDAPSDDPPETNTRWICDPTPPSLPDHLGRAGDFLLHALLVQGPLTVEELPQAVPLPFPIGLPSTLARAGLVKIDQGRVQLVPQRYPYIRQMLSEAGFPADQI